MFFKFIFQQGQVLGECLPGQDKGHEDMTLLAVVTTFCVTLWEVNYIHWHGIEGWRSASDAQFSNNLFRIHVQNKMITTPYSKPKHPATGSK